MRMTGIHSSPVSIFCHSSRGLDCAAGAGRVTQDARANAVAMSTRTPKMMLARKRFASRR